MAFVSVTRLHLRSLRYWPLFVVYTVMSARQVRRADGFVSGTLAGDRERGSWTITVWRDEPAMRAYRNSGAHVKAMSKLLNWCDEASFAHWTQEDATVPAGEVALERLRTMGGSRRCAMPQRDS
jgi:heme-degrading monooxygenase HmoA